MSESPIEVRYPRAYAQLTGQDGNTMSLAGIVRRSILDAGYGREAADAFLAEVFECQSYDAFLGLAMRTVNVS